MRRFLPVIFQNASFVLSLFVLAQKSSRPKTSTLKDHGYTLLELIIVIAISSIICAFAYPTYQSYIIKSSRLEAQLSLQELASRMEQWYAQHGTYESSQNNSALANAVKSDRYELTIRYASNDSYTLQATPTGSQGNQDQRCQSLTLNHLGVKEITKGPWGVPTGSVMDCFI